MYFIHHKVGSLGTFVLKDEHETFEDAVASTRNLLINNQDIVEIRHEGKLIVLAWVNNKDRYCRVYESSHDIEMRKYRAMFRRAYSSFEDLSHLRRQSAFLTG